MNTLPKRTRVRKTTGSRTLEAFIDRHGLQPVSVYLPVAMHRAFTGTVLENETTMQAVMTLACNCYYGHGSSVKSLPPLAPPTHSKNDPHKNVTWYADIDLHRAMKMLAVQIDSSVQQLIRSALLDYMKDAPRVKKLKIKTGYPAYARAPDEIPKTPEAASL